MIVYGHRNREIQVASGQFHCPKCDAQRPYVHKRIARYFTLFFIPLFRLRTLGEYVECQVCRRAFKPIVLGATSLTGADAPTVEQTEKVQGWVEGTQVKGQSATSMGWISIVVGGLFLLVGGALLLLFTAAQLFGDAGPTDNPVGFVGVLVLCPLPLLLVGAVSVGAGILILRRAKKTEKEEVVT
jgi:hypothetical protein